MMRKPDPALLRDAQRAASAAVLADSQMGEAHLALGSVCFFRGRSLEAARALRAALARTPSLGEAHELLGMLLLEAGRVEDGLSRLRLARQLGPELRMGVWEQLRCYELLGNEGEAKALLLDARESALNPTEHLLHVVRYATWRPSDTKRDEITRELSSWEPKNDAETELKWFLDGLMGIHFGAEGGTRYAELLQVLELAAAQPGSSPRRSVFCHQVAAEAALATGDHGAALESIERMASFCLGEVLWLRHCPLLEPLRGVARFRSISDEAQELGDLLMDEIWHGQG